MQNDGVFYFKSFDKAVTWKMGNYNFNFRYGELVDALLTFLWRLRIMLEARDYKAAVDPVYVRPF